MSNLLIEEIDPMLTEAKQNASGKWYINSIFAQSNVKNRNGRIYPKPVLTEAINKYQQDYISQSRALGELQHPNRPKVDPTLAVIKIEKLNEEGNNWSGKALVLDTSAGKNLQALLSAGVKLGISSRALGTLRESNGVNIVQNDLALYAFDVVSDPSAPDAWIDAIMEEYEPIFCPSGQCYVLSEEIKNKIKKASSKDIEKTILDAWKLYCKNLNI